MEVDSDRSRGFSRELVDLERERRGTSRSAVIGVVDLGQELGAGGVPAHGGLTVLLTTRGRAEVMWWIRTVVRFSRKVKCRRQKASR